jgi:hypothetical protein
MFNVRSEDWWFTFKIIQHSGSKTIDCYKHLTKFLLTNTITATKTREMELGIIKDSLRVSILTKLEHCNFLPTGRISVGC